MTRRSYYKFAIWLPILFPPIFIFLVTPIAILLKVLGLDLPAIFALMFISIVLSPLFFGLQYIIFSLGISFWFRNKNVDQIARISWIMPLIFLPICLLGFRLLGSLKTNELIEFTLLTLAFGYGYVLLAHGVAYILTKYNKIEG